MPSRAKDLEGAREITLDARSVPGRVYLIGRGFTLEFDRGIFERLIERELGMLAFPAVSIGDPVDSHPIPT